LTIYCSIVTLIVTKGIIMINGVDLEAMYEDECERRNFRRMIGGKYKIEDESTRLRQEYEDLKDECRD